MSEFRGYDIWKFVLPEPDALGIASIDMPRPAFPFSVGVQDDEIVVWAMVVPTEEKLQRKFVVANTGAKVRPPVDGGFLGSVTTSNGIVWHIWGGA